LPRSSFVLADLTGMTPGEKKKRKEGRGKGEINGYERVIPVHLEEKKEATIARGQYETTIGFAPLGIGCNERRERKKGRKRGKRAYGHARGRSKRGRKKKSQIGARSGAKGPQHMSLSHSCRSNKERKKKGGGERREPATKCSDQRGGEEKARQLLVNS